MAAAQEIISHIRIISATQAAFRYDGCLRHGLLPVERPGVKYWAMISLTQQYVMLLCIHLGVVGCRDDRL